MSKLHIYKWTDVKDPKGVIQVSHGINEHGERYNEFAKFMNDNGYIVYMEDHTSQGKSRSKDEEVVYFGKNGDQRLVLDLIHTKNEIKKDYPDLPIYVLGHSLGTSIIRKYIQNHGCDYEKVIINGGGLAPIKGMNLVIGIGNFLSLFGSKRPSKFFDNIFRQTQLKLKEKVEIDHFIEWLTRDEDINQRDMKDEYLYIRLSVSAFVDMLKLIRDVNKVKSIEKAKHDKPILIMSGTHDPATNFGELVVDLHNIYTTFGYNSRYKLYPEGRHDTLQEINRLEVYQDILDFLEE